MRNHASNSARTRSICQGALIGALLLAVTFAGGCGYHVAGRASQLPSDWKTIAVPAFKNDTRRYRIEQRFTQAVIREFITRTKYRIIQDEGAADGVLHGEVLTIDTTPVLFDSTTGQVTTMLVTVHTKVLLVDNHIQKPVYKNDDMVFRDEYQISSDVQSFFEEQDPALERMSRDFAARLVSNVLEKF
ncbi:MAG TPA: LptE family protein [Candidatus Limnocylindria bacterium]|nr:LptE family protein [Candidatus Limnocylindria bacterium]